MSLIYIMLPALRRRDYWFDGDSVNQPPFRWVDSLMAGVLSNLRVSYQVQQREDSKNYYLDVELPRFKKDEVKVTVEDGFLNILAQRKTEDGQSIFEKCLSIGNVKGNGVKANLEDGVLTVTLPKKVENKPVKIIDVE